MAHQSLQCMYCKIIVLIFHFILTETEEQGAAKDADFSTVTFSTLFTFLIKEKDPKATGAWLVPLIMHITSVSDKKDEEAVLRFKECDTDTALHAAARLSVITGFIISSRQMFCVFNRRWLTTH